MAQTKVKLISDGVIVQGNLHASHGITTAHIGEGSNLYYTDARVGSYLSSNGYATQSTIVAAITDSAPSTLDTLNELAAALGDDVNFSTTVTNSIALKAPIASPTFTGFITTPYIKSTASGNIAFGSVAGISRIQGNASNDIRFLNSSNQDLLTLVASHKGANFAGTVSAAKLVSLNGILELDDNGTHNGIINVPASLRINIDSDNQSTGEAFQVASNATNIDNNNVLFKIEESGKVGIGTISPSSTLSLQNSQSTAANNTTTGSIFQALSPNSGIFMRNRGASAGIGGANYSTQLFTDSGAGNFEIYNIATSSSLVFGTNATERMRIFSNGNVQIGPSSLTNFSLGSSGSDFELSAKKDGTAAINMVFKTQASGGTLGERMRIDSSGNVGIGETNPSFKLDVITTSSRARFKAVTGDVNIELSSIDGHDYLIQSKADSSFHIYDEDESASRLVINSSGNVGIANTSPDELLEISGSGTTYPHIKLSNPGQTGRYLKIGMIDSINHCIETVGGSTFLTFKTVSAERMRITSGGDVLIGTTSAISSYGLLHVKGNQKGITVQDSNGPYRSMYLNSSGNFYFYNGSNEGYLSSSGAWTDASDERIKKNIVDIKYGLEEVLKSKPRSYQMKQDDLEQIGFIAQEMKEIIPECVSGDEERQLGISYGSLVSVAFKAIQELEARIKELENN